MNLDWLYLYGSHETPVMVLAAFISAHDAEIYVRERVQKAFEYDKQNHWVEHIDVYKKRNLKD